MKFFVQNLSELVLVANYIKTQYFNESVHIFINGIIGAGKTSLASLLVDNFNHVDLTSSSYSLINIYDGSPLIVHCDFYRTQWSHEFYDIEIQPIINGHHLLFFEWVTPHVLENSIRALSVEIDVNSSGTRSIEVLSLN